MESGKKRILIGGASGLVGKALYLRLINAGHSVFTLKRSAPLSSQEIYWSPETLKINPKDLEGFDAVIHLGGESIGDGRWTKEKKSALRQSRIQSTLLLSQTLSTVLNKPKVLLVASGVGYYGDRGEEELTENAVKGSGFLSELCRDWEAATEAASRSGIRVVNMRFGLILSPKGGSLKKLLLPFKLGLGGPLGSGKQYMSSLSLTDTIRAIEHLMVTESIFGAVNIASPSAVTNKEFSKTLAKVLKRPCVFSVPSWVLKLMFGEMALELLLSGQRVVPQKLIDSQFLFLYPELEAGLRHEIWGG